MNSELHPLEPFLPANARVLMLGSFPPKRIRWSMDFFYPNLQNDMWRIVGYLATGDKMHFLEPGGRRFDRERFLARSGKGAMGVEQLLFREPAFLGQEIQRKTFRVEPARPGVGARQIVRRI